MLVNPFYLARRSLVEQVAAHAPHIRGRVLDVGCGSKPYRQLFNSDAYVGLDVEQSGHRHAGEDVDVFYDGRTFPFADGEFDSVVSFEALEHVFTPERFIAEIGRVLRPGGTLLLTVPFVWDEHEQPYDYARYSSFGLQHLLDANGFTVLSSVKTCADVRVLAQLVNAYTYKVVASKPTRLRLLGTMLLTAPINIAASAARHLLPQNRDLYLDNVILAEKRNDQDDRR
jgi:SAM-dependent methyltransferase